jgi:ABC-type transport system involved in multi-copper enzyme maturation permease subunit
MFMNLLRAEWIKLSRRPMVLIALGGFLGFLVFIHMLFFAVVMLNDGIRSGNSTIQIKMLNEEQVEHLRQQLRFPGVFGGVLSQINGIGGIFAIILSAGAMGSEYGWGTLRVQLARQPRRGRYLAAKVVVLLIVMLLGIAIAMLAGCVLGLIFGAVRGEIGSVSTKHLWLVPLGMLISLYVLLPYILFTIAIATIGRSVLAGVAGGIIFLIMDVGTGTLSFLSEMGGVLTFIYNLAIQQNITALANLNSTLFGLDPLARSSAAGISLEHMPHPAQAAVLIAIYSTLFAGYAIYWLRSHDIHGQQ